MACLNACCCVQDQLKASEAAQADTDTADGARAAFPLVPCATPECSKRTARADADWCRSLWPADPPRSAANGVAAETTPAEAAPASAGTTPAGTSEDEELLKKGARALRDFLRARRSVRTLRKLQDSFELRLAKARYETPSCRTLASVDAAIPAADSERRARGRAGRRRLRPMRQAESRMEKAFTNMRALAMHLGIDVPSDESEARRCSRYTVARQDVCSSEATAAAACLGIAPLVPAAH